MNIILPGQYPKSEALIQALRNYNHRRINADALESARKEDRSRIQELQREFIHISSGLLDTCDLIRPFTQLIENSSTGEVRRFLATNTFWKVLQGTPPWRYRRTNVLSWSYLHFRSNGLLSPQGPILYTLPFLYLLCAWMRPSCLKQTSEFLSSLVKDLMQESMGALCFIEPYIGHKKLTSQEKEMGTALLSKIKECLPHRIYLSTSFFPLEEEDRTFLFSLPIDGIGIDFYANKLDEILPYFPKDKILLAGILCTSSPQIETEKHWRLWTQSLYSYVDPSRILFTPNGFADFLPRHIMDAKVQSLRSYVSHA